MKENRQPVEVYLAGKFSMKEELQVKARELDQLEIGCTSHWLEENLPSNADIDDSPESAKYWEKVAKQDLNDIYDADIVMLFTIDPLTASKRGGRHFEAGYAAALQHTYGRQDLQFVTVGPRENIFHYLPEFLNFSTWEEAKEWLVKLREERDGKGNSESAGQSGVTEGASVSAS